MSNVLRSTQDEFVKIMEEAIARAEHVNCTLKAFRKGLLVMKEVLDERIYLEPPIKEE